MVELRMKMSLKQLEASLGSGGAGATGQTDGDDGVRTKAEDNEMHLPDHFEDTSFDMEALEAIEMIERQNVGSGDSEMPAKPEVDVIYGGDGYDDDEFDEFDRDLDVFDNYDFDDGRVDSGRECANEDALVTEVGAVGGAGRAEAPEVHLIEDSASEKEEVVGVAGCDVAVNNLEKNLAAKKDANKGGVDEDYGALLNDFSSDDDFL